MARNANATVPRCWYTLVRNRPTPGTPIAKSASLCSANSFTCRGVMICSASDFSSSGLSGAVLRATSSPFTRIVAGRPTLSSRSDALRWTICVIACLKLNVGALAEGASAMWIHSEENLPELDRLRVLDPHLAHHPGDLGLDFVHDLHRFDDAHHLPRGDAAPHLDVRRGAGLGGGIERPHHGGLDLEQLADRGGPEGRPLPPGREGRGGRGPGLGGDHGAPPRPGPGGPPPARGPRAPPGAGLPVCSARPGAPGAPRVRCRGRARGRTPPGPPAPRPRRAPARPPRAPPCPPAPPRARAAALPPPARTASAAAPSPARPRPRCA